MFLVHPNNNARFPAGSNDLSLPPRALPFLNSTIFPLTEYGE
jgi:hypothetical protein